MLASPVAYDVRFTTQGRTDVAEASLWAEGVFVKGYIRFLSTNGQPYSEPGTHLVTGTLADGVLRLTQVGAGPQSGVSETINILRVAGFAFERSTFTGSYTRVYPFLSFPLTRVLGNYELIRKD